MTNYTDTHTNWEAEQREELIEESKHLIDFYVNKAIYIEFDHPEWSLLQIRAKLRFYARQVAKHEAFLKSEGVEVNHVLIFG